MGNLIPNTTGIDSKLQPTVGFSFGLPNNGNGNKAYGNQPQNFLGTGSGANPYPNSGGFSIGALDIAPLVSFQATTNDDGELVNKQISYSYDMPDISFAMSEYSSHQSCRLPSRYLFGCKREQVVDNPYYGVIKCPISK